MRQLRLRNISGMIAVDFLRGSSKGQTRVTQLLKDRAAHESTQIDIYGFTKMGLCERTRQRHGKSLLERSLEQGKPSRIAIHRQLEPKLLEIATYAEAAVVRAPLDSLSPLFLQESPVELVLVEGETGILFTGTKADCDDFVKRQSES